MFNTSRDILFLVLAVCAAGVSVFICLFLYQAIRALRRVNHTFDSVKDKIAKVEESLKKSVSYVGFLGELLKVVIEKILMSAKTKKQKE